MRRSWRAVLWPALGIGVGVALVGLLLPSLVDADGGLSVTGSGSAPGITPGADGPTSPEAASATALGSATTTPGPSTGSGAPRTRDSATATATSAGALTASDVGVTPTSIRIGVWVPDIGAFARIPGLGDTGFDPETYRAAYETFAHELNERGGIHGRRVELVFYTMRSQEEVDSNQQGCIFFTQQEKVFAVVSASVAQPWALECINRASGAVAMSTVGFERRYYDGGWLMTQDAGADRVLRNLVEVFHRRGELKGKRVAVAEHADQQRATDDILLPQLRRAGYDVVHRATLSDDTSQLGSQIPVEVNQMRAKGVQVVFTLLNPAAAGLLIQNADGQGFRPRWLMSDFQTATDDLGPKLFPAGTDALGITSLRSGEFRTGAPEAAYDARCAARYNARTTGRKVRNGSTTRDNPYRYALYGCTAFDLFAAAADAAGPVLTRAGWMAAVDRLGTRPIAFAADATFGPGKHDGADAARLLTLRPSCPPDGVNCWLPTGDFEPTPF